LHVYALYSPPSKKAGNRHDGGCATLAEGRLTLEGLVGDLDGQRLIRETQTGPANDYEKIGIALAEQLLEQGAAEILVEVYGETS